jgi:hypothetical protein
LRHNQGDRAQRLRGQQLERHFGASRHAEADHRNAQCGDAAAILDSGVQSKAAQMGMAMRASSPEEMTARMKADIAKWGAVIAKAHIPKRD